LEVETGIVEIRPPKLKNESVLRKKHWQYGIWYYRYWLINKASF